MAYSDRELLARILQCEAGGEGENGMKAVASVIMNRVHASAGEYSRLGGNLRNVIFQPGQFDCARETLGGNYNPQNIYNMNPQNRQRLFLMLFLLPFSFLPPIVRPQLSFQLLRRVFQLFLGMAYKDEYNEPHY